MTLTASDVGSLSNSLLWWERAEYVCAGLVAIACFGEYLADFTNWFTGGNKEKKERLAKRSTLLLIASLALELVCLVKTNSISGMLIGSLSEKAEAADTKAQSAIEKSSIANTAAGKAQEQADAASGVADKAMQKARAALEYARWRTISDKQADILVKDLAPLKGKSIWMSPTSAADSETVRFFNKLCTVLDGHQVGMNVTVPLVADIHRPGLSFVVFKNREKDFGLIVEALDKAGIEKAGVMQKTADHRPALGNAEGDGVLQLNVGAKH